MVKEAHVEDLAALCAARTAEVDSYARANLDAAIARLTDALPVVELASREPALELDRSARLIQARATEWIAGLLLHELAAPLGLLAYTASHEVPNFELSRTKGHIATLQMVFDAIEQLRKASATPRPTELDLAALAKQIVESEFAASADLIALHGQQPMLLKSDESLLRFAICNGLRNSIEAIGTAARNEAVPIVITWGGTDTDYWVAIIDRGPGISASIESVLGIGKTTKTGHSGFGLPIAAAAMEALGGTITLQRAATGGTKFELRWPR